MIVASGFTPWTIVVGAIYWAAVQLVEAVWDELVSYSWERFVDEDAREEVACFMFNQLRGSVPQWDRWSASLAGFDYDGATDDEEAIATVVNIFNTEEVDVYINYMMMLEELNDVAEYLPECPCDIALIINQLAGELGTEMYGFELCHSETMAFSNPGDTAAVCPAVLDFETELYNHIASSIGGVGANIRVVLPPNVLVTRVRVHWGAGRPLEASYGDKNAGIWVGEPYGDGVFIGGHSWGAGTYSNQNITSTIDNVELVVTTPRTHVYIHNSMDKNNGDCYIQWVHIECEAYVP